MSENESELDREQKRKKWLTRIADELEKTEMLFPGKFLPSNIEYPKWVENVERELSLVMLPAAKLRDANYQITPRRMGALIGHSCEMAVWMMEWFNNELEKQPDTTAQSSEGESQKGNKFVCAFMDWYSAMRRVAKLSLCSCVDQSYQDMSDFLLGYADGFSRKPKTLNTGEFGNPTFEIYHFMIFHWRLIQSLNSVNHLHRVLVKNFSASRIGDQKRIEKICQRIGLSFRKPGRPKMK